MFHVWCLKAAGIRLEKIIKMCNVNCFEETSNFWKNCHDKPSLELTLFFLSFLRILNLRVLSSPFQTALPSHFKPPSTEVSVTALMGIVGVVMVTVLFLIFVARRFGKFAFI